VVNNSGQNEAYPSFYQTQDRVIEMRIDGWGGRKVRLRVIDPPDVSPYAPYGGYPARHDTAVPPYEANDNFGTTDYGIATLPNGSDATVSKVLQFPYPEPDGPDVTSLIFYLKVPARYSGDNFQVEATKCNYSNTVLPQRVMGLSAVYTSWKRAFVERDKMFRRGGLLYQGYGTPPNCGIGGYPDCCGQGGQLPCDQIRVYDWANVSVGDTIVVFDATHPAENGGETRTVQTSDPGLNNTTILTLDSPLTNSYLAKTNDNCSPPIPTFEITTLPDNKGHSGGVGVLSNCDSDPNQINASNSCFYDADMRDIEQPFDDAFVEFFGLRGGMNALPYVSESFFAASDDLSKARFSQIWFNHFQNGGGTPPIDQAHNYFHLIGVTKWGTTGGYSHSDYDFSYSFIKGLEAFFPDLMDRWLAGMAVVDHELVHQYDTNRCTTLTDCNPPYSPRGHHDYRGWWLYGGTGCPAANPCLMDPQGGNMTDFTNRLCVEDLLLGDPNCPDPVPPAPRDGAIRTEFDPK
jgi:hypothetical protein